MNIYGQVGWRAAAVVNPTSPLSTLNTNLYAVYKAENNTNDSLGTYNGTAIGGLTYAAGKSGNSFVGNGTNACISLPNNSMNMTGDCSFSFWTNLATNTTTQTIVSTYAIISSIQYGYIIRFNTNGGVTFSAYSGAGTTIFNTFPSGGAFPTNTWKHIIITKTNSQIKWYIDGVASTVYNGAYTMSFHPSNKAAIGALYQYSGTSSADFLSNGTKLDELNVWNRVLTATEVTELYNGGTGKFYPTF